MRLKIAVSVVRSRPRAPSSSVSPHRTGLAPQKACPAVARRAKADGSILHWAPFVAAVVLTNDGLSPPFFSRTHLLTYNANLNGDSRWRRQLRGQRQLLSWVIR